MKKSLRFGILILTGVSLSLAYSNCGKAPITTDFESASVNPQDLQEAQIDSNITQSSQSLFAAVSSDSSTSSNSNNSNCTYESGYQDILDFGHGFHYASIKGRFAADPVKFSKCAQQFYGPVLEVKREMSDGYKDNGFVFSKTLETFLNGQPRRIKLIDFPVTLTERQILTLEQDGLLHLKLSDGFEYSSCSLLSETASELDCPVAIFDSLRSTQGLSINMNHFMALTSDYQLRLKIGYRHSDRNEIFHQVFHLVLSPKEASDRRIFPLNGGTSTAKFPTPPALEQEVNPSQVAVSGKVLRGVQPGGGSTPGTVTQFSQRYYFVIALKSADLNQNSAFSFFQVSSNTNIDAKTAGLWNFYSNMPNLISREAFSLRLLPQLLQSSAVFPDAIASGAYSQGQRYTTVLNVSATYPVLKCIAAGKVSATASNLKAALHSAFTEAVQSGRYNCL